ncbi:MAG: hypothetical protein JKY70_17880 [Mucilaginibacter sp.]|nr:hypothetical protein [Mucilaginibacter sp.]
MNPIKIFSLALFALVLSLTKSYAQSVPKNSFKLDVGAETMLPFNRSNLAYKEYKFGAGASARLNYGISNSTALTLTSGYYNFFDTKDFKNLYGTDFKVIPVKVGFKTFVLPHIYVNAEAGVAFTKTYENNIKAIYSGGIGWASGGLDIGAKFENYSGQNSGFNTVGLRVAYGFKL